MVLKSLIFQHPLTLQERCEDTVEKDIEITKIHQAKKHFYALKKQN